MSTSYISELTYHPDSCIYFEQIKGRPWPIFLDSSYPYSQAGRYDILSAAPVAHLVTYGKTTTINTPQGQTHSFDDPFALLKTQLAQHQAKCSHLPFNGGALGYFAYDLNKRLEDLPDTAIHDISLPDMSVGIYLWAVIVDHLDKKTYLLNPPENNQPEGWQEIYRHLLNTPSLQAVLRNPGNDLAKLTSNLTKTQYQEKFAQIMQHIENGDTYQINFAQRWQASFMGDPWQLYRQLREKNPAPFAAFIPMPDGAILSCSPERFLTVDDRQVTTMPIKGTAARNAFPLQDQLAAQALLNSDKNRAENIMIVDLMRNDLGKSCIIGSVHVPSLCALQSFTMCII